MLFVVTGLAIVLVGAAVWYGAVGIAGSRGGPLAPMITRLPIVGDGANPTVTRSPTPRLGPPPTPLPGETLLVRLTEIELTEVVRRSLMTDSGGIQVDNPRARIRNGRIEVTGSIKGLLPVPVEVLIAGRGEVRDGRPIIVVDRVEGVGLTLPDEAARRLEQLINTLALFPVDASVTVTRIDTSEGAVTVYGRRR